MVKAMKFEEELKGVRYIYANDMRKCKEHVLYRWKMDFSREVDQEKQGPKGVMGKSKTLPM